jgi:hypothetical protein
MLTWKEAIPILADKFGMNSKTAWVLDRSLANAGLRSKHKGPNPPAYKREEALAFLMACVTARHGSTKAAEIVAPWIGARGLVTAVPSNLYTPDPEEEAEYGEEYSGPIFTYQLEEIEGQAVTFLQFMLALMSDFNNEGEEVPLTITISETGRTIEIETHGGFISQTFYCANYSETGLPTLDIPASEECPIEHRSIIYWHSIQAIIKRTADPLFTEESDDEEGDI